MVALSGLQADEFRIASEPEARVPAGDSTSFTINFQPEAKGLFEVTVNVANDVTNNNPYDFLIRGFGSVDPGILPILLLLIDE